MTTKNNIPAGYKDSAVGIIPQEWEMKRFGTCFSIGHGRDYKHLSNGDIPVYGSGGIMRYVDKFLYDKESVLLPRKGTLNNIQYAKSPFWTVDTLFYCVPQHDYDLDFIYSLYQKVPWTALEKSTGVPSLSKMTINHIKVLLPSLPEQKQIGSLFHQLDDCIHLHEQYVTILIHLKKGLLQKMFPQD